MELQELCTKIDTFLKNHSDYIAFKIGKTKDIERREEEYRQEGYQHIWHLLNGSPEEVSEAENRLEDYFMNTSPHKSKCKNEREGGGSDEADKVYIALKVNNYTVDNVCDDEILIDNNLPAIIEL